MYIVLVKTIHFKFSFFKYFFDNTLVSIVVSNNTNTNRNEETNDEVKIVWVRLP